MKGHIRKYSDLNFHQDTTFPSRLIEGLKISAKVRLYRLEISSSEDGDGEYSNYIHFFQSENLITLNSIKFQSNIFECRLTQMNCKVKQFFQIDLFENI